MKSRGAYETPGGTLLVTAHRELETLCLDRETAHYAQMLSLRYAELVYYGLWFTPLREALDAFFTDSAAARDRIGGPEALQGQRHGDARANRPIRSIARIWRASAMTRYNPKDAEGFINLFALPITAPARNRKVNVSAKPAGERASAAADKLWGGRFDRPPDELFYEFQRSLPFDRRLLPYELAVDRVWARAHRSGRHSDRRGNARRRSRAIDKIAERAATDPAWIEHSPAEDVHHFVEMALVERLGPARLQAAHGAQPQ